MSDEIDSLFSISSWTDATEAASDCRSEAIELALSTDSLSSRFSAESSDDELALWCWEFPAGDINPESPHLFGGKKGLVNGFAPMPVGAMTEIF